MQSVVPFSREKNAPGFHRHQLDLGNFCYELDFGNKELIIDKNLEACHFFGADIPSTYKQAMKPYNEISWEEAVREELTNLSQIDVWTLGVLPLFKKALDGWWGFSKKTNPEWKKNNRGAVE